MPLCILITCRSLSQNCTELCWGHWQFRNVVFCVTSFCEISGHYSLHFSAFEAIMCVYYTVKTCLDYCMLDYINTRREKEATKTVDLFLPFCTCRLPTYKVKMLVSSHVPSGKPSTDGFSEFANANWKSFAYIRQLFRCPYFQQSYLTIIQSINQSMPSNQEAEAYKTLFTGTWAQKNLGSLILWLLSSFI